MKSKFLVGGLIAVLMATCAAPFIASDESNAMFDDLCFKIDCHYAEIYINDDNNSFTFTVDTSDHPDYYRDEHVYWRLIDIENEQVVSFDENSRCSMLCGFSATVYAKNVGIVEVNVYLRGTDVCQSSAIVVVKESPDDDVKQFNFQFKVRGDSLFDYPSINKMALPKGYDSIDFRFGFWISVTQDDTGLSDEEFNAYSALIWLFSTHGWKGGPNSSGLMTDLFGLSTYADDTSLFYWSQSYLDGEGWIIDNTSLQDISYTDRPFISFFFNTFSEEEEEEEEES